jgi:tetratricopeptide (TPR) repeat protein
MPRAFRLLALSLLLLTACNRIETERAPEPAQPGAAERFEPRVTAVPRGRIETVTGTDEYGYPLATADKLELLAWLRAGERERLNEALAFYQAAFEADVRREDWILDALAAFGSTAPDLSALLDGWVAAHPGAWQPLLARAQHRYALALHAGARADPGEGTGVQLERMTQNLELGWDDTLSALELRVDLAMAHLLAGSIATTAGFPKVKLRAFGRALELAPESYRVRRTVIRGLAPRWGGTHAAMESFAASSRSLLEVNPKLALLDAAVTGDRAARKARVGDHEGALTLYGRALAAGPEPSILAERGQTLHRIGRDADAAADFDRSLALRPQDPATLAARARSLAALGQEERARADVERVERLDPGCACLEGLQDVAAPPSR